MRLALPFSSLLFSSLLVAQEAPKLVPPAPPPGAKCEPVDHTRAGVVLPDALARAADVAAVPLPPLPAAVAHDVAADGTLWARGPDWKASCEPATGALTFVPDLGASARQNWPLRLELADASVGANALATQAASARREGERWVVERTVCVEHVDLRRDGVEQSWVFTTLPERGELRLQLAVHTPLRGEDRGDELVFTGPDGGVRYGDAVAIDARGSRCALALDLRGERIELVVPAAFVAAAALPLIVDPVASTLPLAATTAYQGNTSVAFDYTTQRFLIVWERAYSATDFDVYGQFLDLGQTPIGTPFAIELTTASWARPRVANNGLADNFLVVAECSNAFVSPRWIGGRIVGANGTVQPELTIERAGVGGSYSGDATRPDVGGDPAETGSTWYTVVWEREFSPADHDVLLRQVGPNGALRTFAPQVVDVAGTYESAPRIAKSNGYPTSGSPATQYWPVVYQRTFSATDEDVRGALVTADGQFVGPTNFSVVSSGRDERAPVVSSPTDPLAGPQRHAVAYSRLEPTTSTDILVAVCTATGGLLSTTNLQTAEGAGAAAAWPQVGPSIDSDGSRFAVAYKELWSGSGGDFDVRVSTLAHDPATNVTAVHDARAVCAATGDYEGEPAIASAWSGGGGSMHYGLTWQSLAPAGPTYGLHATVYRGHASGPLPTVRATACHGLAIALGGVPALGQVLSLAQGDSGPASGFVIGLPVNAPLGPCPGCTLGVDGTLVGNPFALFVPATPSLVGASLAAQAWSLYSGACLGSIALSDTIDFTLL